ncbi:MAG: SpvB/TcaC N-terminal domain-containing protein [Variibacter sp.]
MAKVNFDWRSASSANQGGKAAAARDERFSAPTISTPKGGGAIQGIGETFSANPVTGTGALSIPLPLSPGRAGFTPSLTLTYDSGAGNGPFGFGWSLGLPNISRRTDRGLPRYRDDQGSDTYLLAGAEDLVPVVGADGTPQEERRDGFRITRYRPRIEGLFARIERWISEADPADMHWRTISRDNAANIYGRTAASRIFDPDEPRRIFTWLICESYDAKGNAAKYDYVPEDSAGIDSASACESNRTEASRTANRYLKRVRYGNRTSTLVQPDLAQAQWLFELICDYGDHRESAPGVEPDGAWLVRPDPFSTHRSGFDVRTYRRCRRFLMFHRFDELGPQPRLVRSLTLDYDDFPQSAGFSIGDELAHSGSTRLGSFLRHAMVTGYASDGFARAMPPLELTYSRPHIAEEAVALDEASGANLPDGIDGSRHQWLDLNGEGIAGVLSDQGGAWWYKSNLGGGRLGPQQLVAQKPSAGPEARAQFVDVSGRGALDFVQLARPDAGFFRRDAQNDWSPFRAFERQLNIAFDDPNLRMLDLTGDGLADVMVTQDDVIAWNCSLADAGFGATEYVRMGADETAGPSLVFNDTTGTVFLADMTADGLADLVRIRNGEVCYWPNLGYGRFGRKVTMNNAPVFDAPELFDPRQLRLSDIDGSGVTDIIYLAADGPRLYFNYSGNGWSAPYALANFPRIDDVSSVGAVDLLANGTTCLVWSTPLPDPATTPIAYLDLMGGQKPHLLIGIENNLGARTRIEYASSTRYYLEDQAAGRPWVTRLPFPVHVVARTETYDDISRNRFVTRFAYHHGFYDGVEREFRGFGMVEKWDTEEFAALAADQTLPPADNIDSSSHVPPALTRTWFHTGAYFGRDHVSDFFAGMLDERDVGEYYREPGLTDAQAKRLLLDDTPLPAGLTAEEERQACRGLKGTMLRQELYALDGTDKASHPYSVSEQNFGVQLVQAQGQQRHAVFLVYARESIGFNYERVPDDPRVSHNLVLETNEYGMTLKSAAVGYSRRAPDPALAPHDQAQQAALHIVYTENDFTNAVDAADGHCVPRPSATRSYEVTGITLPPDQSRFTIEQIGDAARNAIEIAYEAAPNTSVLQKRLIEHERTLYRSDDLSATLPSGTVEARALPLETYKLALTPSLVAQVYGARISDVMLTDAGYVHFAGDEKWWIPSGRAFYSPSGGDSAAQEFAFAQQHFFQPCRYQGPMGAVTTVRRDAYDLLLLETEDALGNRITAGERGLGGAIVPSIDYRVLAPTITTDANGNRVAASFDAIGMIIGTAVMGKRDETPRRGDRLDGFIPDLPDDVIAAHLADPLGAPEAILSAATSRLVYDLSAYYRSKAQPQPSPNVVYAIVRETHDADLAPGQHSKTQHSFSYSDGFGREIQKKRRVESGPVPQRDPATGRIVLVDGHPVFTDDSVTPRWVASGWTVFNNKGDPIRQFEPFFTDRQSFEADTRIGVGPLLFYDPMQRLIGNLQPNSTWEKVSFSAWRQENWDVNDTALIADPATDADVGDFFRRLPAAQYLPTWHAQRQGGALGPDEQRAAEQAAIHAATPALAHADPLGRAFLTVAHNRTKYSDEPPTQPPAEAFYTVRVAFDIEGNQRQVFDAADRLIAQYDYDILGNRIHSASMEAGERRALANVLGQPAYAWDSRGNRVRTVYDPLQRPTDVFLREGDGPERLVGRTAYGEGLPDAEAHNARGKPIQQFDQAGVATADDYDFKGNVLTSRRQLAQDYKTVIDWSASVPLETDIYVSSSRFDALNRPIEVTASDASVVRQTFNEDNLLESIEANLRGEAATTVFVGNVDYDAKGRRTRIEYGNGVTTDYAFDRLTSRLTSIITRRDPAQFPDDCPQTPAAGWPGCQIQNLTYTYDPKGNITHIRDDAQQTIYFRNRRIEPSADYAYDATYRLIEASGREHLGQVSGTPAPGSYNDRTRIGILLSASDGNAMGRYVERYAYDAAGNFAQVAHRGSDPLNPGWTRVYACDETSQLEPAKRSNRLTSTTIATPETYSVNGDGYDAHGNMLRMPQLQAMQWDFRNQLRMTQRQAVNADDGDGVARAGERTWYVYDASGQRVRKVTEAASGDLREQRIYLKGFEVYRREGADPLVRETLHITDDAQRVASIETRTQGADASAQRLIRYQFTNQLGSAVLELDHLAQVISYEEYTPFGCSSFQAVRSQTETPRRYRYIGKERDEESGLQYHGARYYAPWLGRWVSTDPKGIDGGPNLYVYANNSPVLLLDRDGKQPALNSNFQNGWTYKSSPGVIFFQYEPGTFAYSDDDFKTIKPIDNKKVSIILNNGIPILDFLDEAVYEVPEMLLDPNPGEISSAGTRWHAKGPRQFYRNPRALDYAMAGYTKEAEIWEAGHGCAGCHIEFLTNGPVPNSQLDLDRYTRVALLTKLAADIIGAKYDPRSPFTYVGMGFKHVKNAAALQAEADALAAGAMADLGWAPTVPLSLAERERLDNAIRQRMDELGIPKNVQQPFAVGNKVGNNIRPSGGGPGAIWIDSGILSNTPHWPEWNAANLETRVDAILAHEWAEHQGATHLGAVLTGQETTLKITEQARQLLDSMPIAPWGD